MIPDYVYPSQLEPIDGMSSAACEDCIRVLKESEKLRLNILLAQVELKGRLKTESYPANYPSDHQYIVEVEEAGDDEEHFYANVIEVESSEPTPKPKPQKRTAQKKASSVKVLLKNTVQQEPSKPQPPAQARQLKYVCELCGKGYENRNQLSCHKKMHRERKTEKCKECGKCVLYLREHIKACHLKYWGGTCPLCNKAVTHIANHMRTVHSEATKVTCPECGKRFSTARSLERHMSLHTGLKFACTICTHEASSFDTMRIHTRKKHPEAYSKSLKEKQRKLYQQRVREAF